MCQGKWDLQILLDVMVKGTYCHCKWLLIFHNIKVFLLFIYLCILFVIHVHSVLFRHFTHVANAISDLTYNILIPFILISPCIISMVKYTHIWPIT